MPNSVRTQPIWLPTGNPDTTNILAADMTGQGGQLGSVGQKFDYNDRVYQRVLLDSGATASTPTGIPAIGQVLFWKNKATYEVTNNRAQAVGGSGTNSYANMVAGILRLAATPGNYVDIVKQGNNINVLDGGNTFAVGERCFAELDSVAAADRVGVGSDIVYNRLGIARGPATGGFAPIDVDIEVENQ